MSLRYPDIFEANNPLNAQMDSNFVRGGARIVADLTALYALASYVDQLKEHVTKVYVISSGSEYILTDISNVGNSSGWTLYNPASAITSLTTTGNSGAATLLSNVLNIPNYTLVGLGGEPIITASTTAKYWRGDKTFQTLDTSVVPENTNLYWTSSRFNTAFSGKSTTDLSEGTNLYYTQSRFDTAFAAKSTTNLAEGTNLYYLDSRARAAISATSPIFYNSSTGIISSQAASGSQNGYLLSSDWTIFNNKQTALSGTGFVKITGTTISYDSNIYITTISGITAGGDLSGTYPNPTVLNSAVVGKVLTGLNLTGGGTIVSTDSILQAFGKVQNQISALVGGVMYQGNWNASTNSPTLTSSIGTKGYYYIVSVAGTTNLNGITDWQIGDWAIFDGTVWDKVDNTDAVSSVNGFTGAVSLTTANISEVTNLYYTNTRAIGATLTGYTSGAGTISSSDSILGAIQKLNGNISALTTGVSSVFGRTGAVVATSGDYDTLKITENTNLYYTNARAIAATLTGYTSGAGTISSSDSILSAIQKLNGNDGLKEPAITAGTTGQYWRGDKSWQTLNAAAISGGATLSKTDDTNVTLTLGGSYTSALLAAASLTLGWTGTLADGRITSASNWNTAYNRSGTSLTFTSSTFTFTKQDASTLTVSVPTFNQNTTGSAATLTTPRAINGVNFDGSAAITVTAAAGTLTGTTLNSTVVSSSLTSVGTIGTGVWQATAIADSYISSASTWNGKQAALSGTGIVKSVSGTISYLTDNSGNWNTAYSWGNWASNFGSSAGTIAQGNDSRINNGQTAYSWGNPSGTYLPLAAGSGSPLTGNLFISNNSGSQINIDKSTGGSIAFKQSGTQHLLLEDDANGLGVYTGSGASLGTTIGQNITTNVVNGTSASFSGNVGVNGGGTSIPFTVGNGNGFTSSAIAVINTANANKNALVLSNWIGSSTSFGPKIFFDNSTQNGWYVGASDAATSFEIGTTWGTPFFKLASTGAATFSSTITSGKITSTSSSDYAGIFNGSFDATTGIVLDVNSNVSGRASTIQYSDGATYNYAMGADASGTSFGLWSGRYPTSAGTKILSITSAGAATFSSDVTAANYYNVNGVYSSKGGSGFFNHYNNSNTLVSQLGDYGNEGLLKLWGSNGVIAVYLSGYYDNYVANNGQGFAIGTTSASGYKLYVSGTGYFTGYLTASGGAGTSDIRLKTNIVYNPSISILDSIDFIQYNMKDNLNRLRYGFIAQQLEPLYPDLVLTAENGDKAIMYDDLHNIQIHELYCTKASKTEVEILRQRVNDLEEQLKLRG